VTTRQYREDPSKAKRQYQGEQSKLKGGRGLEEWTTLYQAYNAIFKLTELGLLPHGLSLPQLHLLCVLEKGGGILTTGEIGRAMVKASQTITGLVDRLEEPGLVERVFDRRDRRKTWVRLTEKGERKLADAFPVGNRLAEELSSVLNDEELKDLQAKIEKLRNAAMEKLAASLNRL
jgi:DNA-binding MarR family transcriptional regulator